MITFYFIALLPVLVGLYFWWKDDQVVWWEWLAGSAIAFVLAALFHAIAIESQCHDKEIFSGAIVSAEHHPWWQSRVSVDDYVTTTDSKGNTHRRKVGSHYEYSDHPEHWVCEADYGTYTGSRMYDIEPDFFQRIADKFCAGKLTTTSPYKSDFYRGDRHVYVAENKTGYCFPMTTKVSFQNRIKAAPSLYSYAPVPKDAKVFEYPSCSDPFQSDRLLGTAASTMPKRDFDVLCSMVGPMKKVNLIVIGFGDMDSEIAHLQEAAWIGGKKNDLVMCYGGKDPKKPSWAYVFGWTDKTLVKANLETILLENPVDATILPKIKDEVRKNYEIKQWKDFNYLQVDPPAWSYWVYVIVLILAQGGFWYWARINEFGKGSCGYVRDHSFPNMVRRFRGFDNFSQFGGGGFR